MTDIAAEYRPTMDAETLHAWAKDAVTYVRELEERLGIDIGCQCATCDDGRKASRAEKYQAKGEQVPYHLIARTRMILCPDCGNKRCPRATFHEHDCSGSNDPGQEGSAY